MKKISYDTKISELLDNFENAKDVLISINPKFKKLNNPILRRTLAKVATIKQAAIIGGMDPKELLDKLNQALGVEVERDNSIEDSIKADFDGEIIYSYDANKLLDENKNPLAIATKALKEIKDNEAIEIISDFKPQPLIDEFKKSGFKVAVVKKDNNFYTFIKK
ncbi:MAG: DUF1858 domain-containing protein [Epsilonproteobacteria bacterium]|nr:DUF1858 domain-containing protein [Campylobacterota bacterium]